MLILRNTVLMIFLLGGSVLAAGETRAQQQGDRRPHADSAKGIARLAGTWKGRIQVHGKSVHYLLTLKANPRKSDFRLIYVWEEMKRDTCRSQLSHKRGFGFTQEMISRSCSHVPHVNTGDFYDTDDFFGIVRILPGWQIPGDSTATVNMFTKRGGDIASGLLRRVDTSDEAEPSH
ncbi:hypothetical protein GGP70_000144 [Salinibacter ruber]|nr:hypothetical protein [Salinibacter ruber]